MMQVWSTGIVSPTVRCAEDYLVLSRRIEPKNLVVRLKSIAAMYQRFNMREKSTPLIEEASLLQEREAQRWIRENHKR